MSNNPVLQLCFMALLLAGYSGEPTFHGRVISENGSPIPNASVVMLKAGKTKPAFRKVETDSLGIFESDSFPEAIYISQPGYLPVLHHPTVEHNGLFVLEPLEVAPGVTLPECKPAAYRERALPAGFGHRLVLSGSIEADQTSDVDTIRVLIPSERSEHPLPDLRDDPYSVPEGDLMYVLSGMYGYLDHPPYDLLLKTDFIRVRVLDKLYLDITGITRDGRHWRHISLLAGAIGYDHASPESAAFFDRQIEHLCRTPPSSENRSTQ